MKNQNEIAGMLAAAGASPGAIENYLEGVLDSVRKMGAQEAALFIGQCAHETAGFTRMIEATGYTEPRARAVFGRRVPADLHWSGRAAGEIAQALFNATYGGRMGNNTSGDGHRFIGRGAMHLTGRDNYQRAFDWLKIKQKAAAKGMKITDGAAWLAAQMDLKRNLHIVTAAWYWYAHGAVTCHQVATDKGTVWGDKIAATTRIINGGNNGLADRVKRAGNALNWILEKKGK